MCASTPLHLLAYSHSAATELDICWPQAWHDETFINLEEELIIMLQTNRSACVQKQIGNQLVILTATWSLEGPTVSYAHSLPLATAA